MTRALLYLRQSDTSGAGRDSLSLASQQSELERAAVAHGWHIIGVVSDPDEKGWDDQRPGLLELYARCEAGGVDLVAFWKLDRFARSLRIQENVLHALTRLGVDVWSHQEPWVAQALFRQILGAVNEEQTRIISANVRRALHERQRRGLLQGRVPWGYVRAGKDAPLTIDQNTAAIVRGIYEQRAAGVGPAAIARDLTARGILTPDGHPWPATSVMRLLGQVTYRGAIRAGDEIIEGCHEPIVPDDVWYAAQRRSGHRRPPRRKESSSWLEGLIEHACGMPMYLIGPYHSKAYAEFRCRAAGAGMLHAEQAHCAFTPRYLRQSRAETLAWDAVTAALARIFSPARVLAMAQREYAALAPMSDAARNDALERKKRAVARRSRAEDLYLSGARDRAWFDAEDALLGAEIAAVDVQLAALPRPPDPEAITLAFEAVSALRDQADSIAPEDRGIVLRAMGKVVVGASRDAPIRVVPRPELRGFFPGSDT